MMRMLLMSITNLIGQKRSSLKTGLSDEYGNERGNRSGGIDYATAGSSAWVSGPQGRSEGAGVPV